MPEALNSFKKIAIVQFPEQIRILKDYFDKNQIQYAEVLWVAITDSALYFLEKEGLNLSCISDYYNHNDLFRYIFDESYDRLGNFLKRVDLKLGEQYSILNRFSIGPAQNVFYWLRLWCDSVEQRLYELLSLKENLNPKAVYYVSYANPEFSCEMLPYYNNHSLDPMLKMVFPSENLVDAGYYDPSTSIVGYQSKFESQKILKLLRKGNFLSSCCFKFWQYYRRIKQSFSQKRILCYRVPFEYFNGHLSDDIIFSGEHIDCFEYDISVKNIIEKSFKENDFKFKSFDFKVYMKTYIQTIIGNSLSQTFHVIKNYEERIKNKEWTAFFCTGFNTIESKVIANLFRHFGAKVYCLHHGSLGILKDKINKYYEYPFCSDYFAWGPMVASQIKREGDFSGINIHIDGSPQLDSIAKKKQLTWAKKKRSLKKPIIVFLLQSVNDGVRVTLDHPPGTLDFKNQRELISSLLKTNEDFDLVIKGHPSIDGYHSPLRYAFEGDPRVHYISSIPLQELLLRSHFFITDRPSTSLMQALAADLKCYALVNSEFYNDEFKKILENDGILFSYGDKLVGKLHEDIKDYGRGLGKTHHPSSFYKSYCNPYGDCKSYRRILNVIKNGC